MSHISTFTIRDDTETVMAADMTPRLHEIKTGFCNMLVEGDLPVWRPFTTVRPLIISSITPSTLFFHPKLILQLSCSHASSVPHWMHLIEYIKQSLQSLHSLHRRSRLKEKRGIWRSTEIVWRLKRCPDCVNAPNVHLPPRWNIHSLPSEKTNHWFYGSWCRVALVKLGLASCLLNVKLYSHRQTGQQMIYEKCDSTKSQRGLHLAPDGWK